MVVIGGVIPAQDYQFLYDNGASAIFGPGTVIPVAAQKVIQEIYERLGYEEVENKWLKIKNRNGSIQMIVEKFST